MFNALVMRSTVVFCAVITASRAAFALDDGLYEGATSSARTPRSVEAAAGTTTVHFVAVRSARVRRASLSSTSNDNDRYRFTATVAAGRARSVLVLLCDRRAFVAQSEGADARGRTVEFSIDQHCADAVSRATGAARLDRRVVGASVSARFAVSSRSFARGVSVDVALSIENPAGSPRVQRRVGGQQRGPRDNQFSFRVFRDGALLPERPGPDFGGPTGFVALEPGAPAVLRAPLDRWADLSSPGLYRVECSYETELAPEETQPFDPAQRHLVWRRRFEGVVEFRIEPTIPR